MKRFGQLGLVAALMLGAACAPRAPEKPAGVPAESFWVGTRKTGVFVVIGPKERDGWRIKAFDDRQGTPKADGVFTLRGIARAELTPEELVAFDGTAFKLSDGALLVPKAKP